MLDAMRIMGNSLNMEDGFIQRTLHCDTPNMATFYFILSILVRNAHVKYCNKNTKAKVHADFSSFQ